MKSCRTLQSVVIRVTVIITVFVTTWFIRIQVQEIYSLFSLFCFLFLSYSFHKITLYPFCEKTSYVDLVAFSLPRIFFCLDKSVKRHLFAMLEITLQQSSHAMREVVPFFGKDLVPRLDSLSCEVTKLYVCKMVSTKLVLKTRPLFHLHEQ